jgi:hypothetical protein
VFGGRGLFGHGGYLTRRGGAKLLRRRAGRSRCPGCGRRAGCG